MAELIETAGMATRTNPSFAISELGSRCCDFSFEA